jgi:hypothetical protein
MILASDSYNFYQLGGKASDSIKSRKYSATIEHKYVVPTFFSSFAIKGPQNNTSISYFPWSQAVDEATFSKCNKQEERRFNNSNLL